MLPPADNLDEYAAFLSDSIRQHLDDEWLPQECHRDIGEEVARLYRAAVQQVSWRMLNISRFLFRFLFAKLFFRGCRLCAGLWSCGENMLALFGVP